MVASAQRFPRPNLISVIAMGADRKLLDWSKVVSYFQLLKDNSDRIRVDELGKSTEGRPFIAATIAAPETLRNLDKYRQNSGAIGGSQVHHRCASGEVD